MLNKATHKLRFHGTKTKVYSDSEVPYIPFPVFFKPLNQPFVDLKFCLLPNFMSTKYCCMMLKINIDCNGCYRKVRRIVLNMKEVETHMIEKQQCRISVCGRFRPSDVAIKMRKKMKRRVEILEIQEFDETNEQMEQPRPIEDR